MQKQAGDTESRLVETAIRLFASRWYSSVSVAEICREADLSNGVFYRYFPNKDALVRHVLEDVITRIADALDGMEGSNPAARLSSMSDILVRFSVEHPDLITVFREGQYRYFDFELRLTEMYRRVLGKALGKTATMAEYLFALGGTRFVAVRGALQGQKVSTEVLADILRHGLFRGMDWNPDKVFGITVKPLPIAIEDSSRERLLRSGKRLFGEKDYNDVQIHEITDAAGLSVGAFYKYFDSKESFFAEQIEAAGKDIRRFISANLSADLNRLEREMQGIFLFGVFLSIDRHCYGIVREGEFVVPLKVREYYDAFKKGYHKPLSVGHDPIIESAEPLFAETAIEFLLGVSHYYGLEVTFDESPHNARAIVEELGDCLSRGLSA